MRYKQIEWYHEGMQIHRGGVRFELDGNYVENETYVAKGLRIKVKKHILKRHVLHFTLNYPRSLEITITLYIFKKV